jgi:hypothetical protein
MILSYESMDIFDDALRTRRSPLRQSLVRDPPALVRDSRLGDPAGSTLRSCSRRRQMAETVEEGLAELVQSGEELRFGLDTDGSRDLA